MSFLVWSRFAVVSCVLLIVADSLAVQACTVVRYQAGDMLIVARNHDWPFGEGLVIVNPRGLIKTALVPVNPAQWVSAYGSVSLTQFGREIPFAGMNERGLTVDLLELREAEFPQPNEDKASVNVIQWVQYQLDTAATVDEVIASLETVQPVPMIADAERVHFFVTDAEGDVAVIEFLGGKPVIQHGALPAQCALANSTWNQSAATINAGARNVEDEWRYLKALRSIDQLPQEKSLSEQIDFAFTALNSVAQERLTQWQIVYQPTERRIEFRTTRSSARRSIDLDQLSFDADRTVRMIDVDADHSGNLLDHLKPYDPVANRRIVDGAFDRFMQPGFVRASVKQLVLSYPETLKVAEPVPAKR